jgi:hypothetical protein
MRELSSAEIEAVNGAYGVPGAVAGAAAGAAGYAGSMLGGGKFSGRDLQRLQVREPWGGGDGASWYS